MIAGACMKDIYDVFFPLGDRICPNGIGHLVNIRAQGEEFIVEGGDRRVVVHGYPDRTRLFVARAIHHLIHVVV